MKVQVACILHVNVVTSIIEKWTQPSINVVTSIIEKWTQLSITQLTMSPLFDPSEMDPFHCQRFSDRLRLQSRGFYKGAIYTAILIQSV